MSPQNYSITYFAEHAERSNHDVINRFLQRDKYSCLILWEHIEGDVVFSEDRYWVIDYRIYQPAQDSKSKVDHLLDMLNNAIYSSNIAFSTVFFNIWYTTHKIMAHIDSLNEIDYAPLKANRNVSKVNSNEKYQHVSTLSMADYKKKNRTLIHVKEFPKDMNATLFQFTISTNRVDYIITNDKIQNTTQTVQDAYSMR